MKFILLFSPLWVLLSSLGAVSAEWEHREREVSCEPGQPEIRAGFSFRNQGGSPVRVAAVSSSCGCTVADTPDEDIAAGARATIEVVFTIGDRVGPQRKTIRVTLEDGEESKTTTLVLKTDIPEELKIEPRLLLWRTGNSPEAKSVAVHALPGMEWTLPADLEERIPFTWKILDQEESGRKQLVVTPVLPMKSGKWKIPLEVPGEEGDPRTAKSLYLLIR